MTTTRELMDAAEQSGVTLPETPLHTVWHFGKLYQWSRRMDGVHVMRPADEHAPDAGYYQVGTR